MTTKNSPLHKIKAQADNVARLLKAAERGEKIEAKFAEKIEEARSKESFKFCIFMDDKIISITMPWSVINESSEAALSEFVVKQMREERDNS